MASRALIDKSELAWKRRAEKAERERDEALAFGARLREALADYVVERHTGSHSPPEYFCTRCEGSDVHAPDCLLHPDFAPADPQAGRVAELERALEPFAAKASHLAEDPDDALVLFRFSVKEFRNARAALFTATEEKDHA